MIEGIEEVIYVGMEEVTEEETVALATTLTPSLTVKREAVEDGPCSGTK